MSNYLLVLGLVLIAGRSCAQDWEKRHRFAETYVGVSNYVVPEYGSGNYLNSTNVIEPFKRSGFVNPSINIGATHFWGYADIYVSISTADIKFKKDAIDNFLRLNVFTGFKVYPFPLKNKSIRPYLGYKFSPFTYNQKNLTNQSYKYTSVKSIFDFGVAFWISHLYLNLEYSRIINPDFNTYLSRTV